MGFSPFQTGISAYIKKFVYVTIYVCVVTSSCLEILTNFNKATLVRGFEVICIYYQVKKYCLLQFKNIRFQLGWKFFVLFKHNNTLKRLVEESKVFWELDVFGDHHENTNSKIHKLLGKSFQTYRWLLYFSCLQYIGAAILTNKSMLLSYGETQGLNLQFRILYFMLHSAYMYMVLCFMLGFDGLFFYIIAHILSELKMVKAAFGNSPIPTQWNSEKRFRMATKHHRFVLKHEVAFGIRYQLFMCDSF